MCARCGQGIVGTGDGQGGAAVLGHHADGTSQGLQVFRGQADLPTGRRRVSWECSGGLSEAPGRMFPSLPNKVNLSVT